MKAILLSIRPEWLAKILNGWKLVEIRKLFPKDFVGWIYLYCTKSKTLEYCYDSADNFGEYVVHNGKLWDDYDEARLNGRVVAKFWCDKVEEIGYKPRELFSNDYYYLGNTAPIIDLRFAVGDTLCNNSCLTQDEIHSYLKGKNGFAIHISQLEIFDDPKELWEFYRQTKHETTTVNEGGWYIEPLTKAPQNYCWVEENNE